MNLRVGVEDAAEVLKMNGEAALGLSYRRRVGVSVAQISTWFDVLSLCYGMARLIEAYKDSEAHLVVRCRSELTVWAKRAG